MTIELSNEQAANELKAMQEHVEPYMSVVGLTAYNMAIKALEQQQNIHDICKNCVEFSEFIQTGWIPVSEKVAEFPCLACDIFEQIFIPCGIVVLDSRCYEGKDFAFNVEKFLRGKEVILCGGKKVYEKPREIVAWMPLPEPYKAESEGAE